MNFFFQAEDGIRDGHVTGVQTCALPICIMFEPAALRHLRRIEHPAPVAVLPAGGANQNRHRSTLAARSRRRAPVRSEERRVGKESRSRWWSEHVIKKMIKELFIVILL